MKRAAISLLLLGALILAACGNDKNDDKTQTPNLGDENAMSDINYADNGTPVSQEVSFDPIVFGLSTDPEQTDSVAVTTWSADRIDNFFALVLSNDAQNVTVTLSNIPQDIQPGTYALGGDGPTATLQLGTLDSGTLYDRDLSGELTITETGGHLSGIYQFTAAETNSEAGSASGTFVNLPVS